jgi:Ca-activated chloride channel homolog
MTFTALSVLVLLLMLPLMALLMLWRGRVRAAAVRRIGDADLVRYLSAQVSPTRRFWKSVLWLAAVGSLILALARPVWGVDTEVIEAQGVSVMVVLDVSTSMDAQDIAPSRLERAKLDLHTLFNGLTGHEIGLILFAGTAFIQFPLTSDIPSAQVFLNAANTSAITRQGTAIDSALRLAMDAFDDRRAAQSIIVLVSDGENWEVDPMLAAGIAAERGIRIHALGYGSIEGAPIPIRHPDGSVTYKADQGNNVILSRLNETTLQSIAGATGGRYQHASESGTEVATLVNEINAVEGGALNSQMATRQVERFGIFVLLAVLALTLEMLLPETRRR